MDLSKLPKLSDTKAQTETSPTASDRPPEQVQSLPASGGPQPARFNPYANQTPNIGGDIWISLIIGLIMLYLGATFGHYAIAKLTHQPFHTGINWTDGPKSGSEVDYFELEGFTAWSDMGIFVFGLILLFEAAAKTLLILKPGNFSKALLVLAIALTVVGIGINVFACIKMFSVQITPLLSVLAIAFGGWILIDEWMALQRVKLRLG